MKIWTAVLVMMLGALWNHRSGFAAEPERTNPAASDRLAWWREARFGLFIHWGPVSLQGTEISWSRANSNPACPNRGPIPVEIYDHLYKKFNPTNFHAEEWIQIAQAAGMRYVVLTAKHHDGFCLWPTKSIDYHIGNSPFRRDVCGELAAATQQKGLRLGWYYSPMDWSDPDCRTERNAAYLARMRSQIQELLSNYGKIDLLWFDTDGKTIPWDQSNTYRLVRTAQPAIIVNNRLECGEGGFSASRFTGQNADYYTPEQVIGGFDDQRPWETCMTLGTQWSWKPNDTIKSVKDAVRILARCVGGDGNLLLNVGPRPDGTIEPRQIEVLNGMGAWLAKCGESIYGTRGGPFKPGRYGASTRKNNTVYLHLFHWPGDWIKLPPLPAKVVRHALLTGGLTSVRQTATSLEVMVPHNDRSTADTVVALELDRPASSLPVVDVPTETSNSLASVAKATASNVFHSELKYGPDKAVDGNDESRWATDSGTKAAWLELDFGKELTFRRATLAEAFPERVQKFELQRFNGSQWQTFASGSTIGEFWSREFAPITAQRVRLHILEATEGPTISEFQLF